MKLQFVKLANAVSVAGDTRMSFESGAVYEVQKEQGFEISILHKTSGKRAFTTFFNVIQHQYADESKPVEKKQKS